MNYSIIIPHKNSPLLLDRCLMSIPQRDDVEIIVVDDNSDDYEVVQNVVRRFSRAILLKNEGVGAGGARNTALKKVCGRWLLFADADDFFHDNFLDVVDKYSNSDIDIVFFDVDSRNSDTLEVVPTRHKFINPAIKNNDVEFLRWGTTYVWAKLFSTKLVTNNNIKFDEVLASNDVMFAYKSSYYGTHFCIDKFVLYCNTVRLDSLCYHLSQENIKTRIDVRINANAFLDEIGKNQYHVNLFSLYLYYRNWGWLFFLKKLFEYIKVSNVKFILYDFKLSCLSVKKYVKEKGNGRSSQKIIR